MAKIEIKNYQLLWSPLTHGDKGRIRIFSIDKKSALLKINDPTEFQMLSDMLRNEKPIYYETNKKVIFTDPENIGEGEV